jgi:hypothetical protein
MMSFSHDIMCSRFTTHTVCGDDDKRLSENLTVCWVSVSVSVSVSVCVCGLPGPEWCVLFVLFFFYFDDDDVLSFDISRLLIIQD